MQTRDKAPEIVYSTDWKRNTVTIDYDQTMHLFLSQQEGIQISPKRVLQMMHTWVKSNCVGFTASQEMHITMQNQEAQCAFTPTAYNALSHLYHRTPSFQQEFPSLSRILTDAYVVVVSL